MLRRLVCGYLLFSWLSLCSNCPRLQAEENLRAPLEVTPVSDEKVSEKSLKRINVALKTAGGTQLWTDHVHRHGYRIQRNAITGHWRLLDSDDVRRTWGTREQCEIELQERLLDEETTGKASKYVILLHGLMRSHRSMKPLEKVLQTRDCGQVIRFSYASTRSSISDHAAALHEVLSGLPNDAEIAFVGHSMGNIVVRHLIGDLQQQGDPSQILERCQCMVMLGPPNNGAAIARRLASTGLFGMVAGQGGLELGPKWDELAKNLAVPPFPFAIIAGDLSEKRVTNPLINGSSDFVVTIDETRLAGHTSFTTVPVLHSLLMNDAATQQMIVEFLRRH